MKYDLIELQEYYINTLVGKSFVFETNYGRIVVRFDESNFCHLIGLHHFNPAFKGNFGWKKIKNKEITHSLLKQINAKLYKNTFKTRAEVLYEIPKIFQSVTTIQNFTKVSSDKEFECDFMFYDHVHHNYLVVTTFIDKDTNEYCAGASLMQLSDRDPRSLSYLHPLNDEISVFSYYIDESNALVNDIKEDNKITN